jgi:ribonuclease J
MARGESPYELARGDAVVFAARTIPSPTNEAQRDRLDTHLRKRGVRVFDDIHVSGHLCREGHYEMLGTLDPDVVIPGHGDMARREPYVEMAEREGYRKGEDVFVPRNGEQLTLVE